MKELSKEEAYSRATALCSKSEKCVSDIRKKLYDWHIDADQHDEVIDRLIDNKYIDEERFAHYFVRDKYRFNRWGRVKIRYHLSQKRIPSFLLDQALSEIDEEVYEEILLKALQTKMRSIKVDQSFEVRQKLMQFAAGRGFTPDEINRGIDEIMKSN